MILMIIIGLILIDCRDPSPIRLCLAINISFHIYIHNVLCQAHNVDLDIPADHEKNDDRNSPVHSFGAFRENERKRHRFDVRSVQHIHMIDCIYPN